MTVAFTAFLPEVLPLVPGCSDILAVNAIRNATIEFCTNTLYWQEVQDEVTLSAADFPYPLDYPAGGQAVTALGVAVEGRPLGQTTQDILDLKVLNWRIQTGAPRVYFQYNPNEIGTYPALDRSYAMVMRVAIAPSRTASGVIDFVYEKHLETIVSGALTRLFQMPAQPWSSETQGAHYRSQFNTWMVQATIEANKAYNRGQMQVMMRPGV
jgi:hypothetical protein